MKQTTLCLFLVSLLSASCSYTNRSIPKAAVNDLEIKQAQAVTSAIVNKNFSEIQPYLSSDISEKSFSDNLDKMAVSVPSNPTVIEPFQIDIKNENGNVTKLIRFELAFQDGTKNVLNLLNRSDGEPEKIYGFHFQDGATVQKLTSFSFENKPLINFIFLFLSILTFIVTVLAVISCLILRSKRWLLWVAFIYFGVILFELNWATNHIDVQLLRIVGLAGYISKKGFEYSPWFVGVSIPFGAIIFLVKYKNLLLAKLKRTPKGN